MSADSRYIIGIDLGTTNVAAAWIDTHQEEPVPQVLPITQVTAAGELDERSLLPSFLFLPDENERAEGSLDLPWASGRDYCVGTYARACAATLPGKTISSAKSWLCAPNVDRLSPILPWNRRNPERQISPVEAAKRLLSHVRDDWNRRYADEEDARFEDQEIVLTVPASFDAVARELTVRAAADAGIRVVLLEEPQAAFYAWLEEHLSDWRSNVSAGDRILVCDIGGGTTDFSLIEVRDEDGDLSLERIAVGEHILLGGDNMDLTLAMTIAARLQQERGMRLDNWQLAGLTHACREAKEALSEDADCESRQLTILGRGSSLIGGTISTELTRQQLQDVLVDGFFPRCTADAQVQESARAGLRTFGLQYAADPGITRHLAAFLARHLGEGELPSAVLFNGGVSKSTLLRNRVADVLTEWRGGDPVVVLTGTDPDLAVASGACAYGNVRRGNSIRIKAGSSHACYIGVESSMPAIPGFAPPVEALCVVPFGMEEGTSGDVPFNGLGLIVGEPTEFRFFESTERPEDAVGEVLPDAGVPALREMPALRATLPVDDQTPAGTLVPVTLRTVLSEIGTVQIWCREEGGERTWKLEFDLRAGSDVADGEFVAE